MGDIINSQIIKNKRERVKIIKYNFKKKVGQKMKDVVG